MRLKHCADQYFSLSGKNSYCSFSAQNTKDRGRAEQTKQDNKMMTFRKGLGRTFPFSANAFPAFRLSRKLLLIVGGFLPIASRAATVLYCSTIRPTPDASTSPHILNGEHQMRIRTGLVLLKDRKQRLRRRRLAPYVATVATRARVTTISILNSFLFDFTSQKKSVKKLFSSSFTEV